MPRPAPVFPPYAPRVRCMRIRGLLVEGWDLLGAVLFFGPYLSLFARWAASTARRMRFSLFSADDSGS